MQHDTIPNLAFLYGFGSVWAFQIEEACIGGLPVSYIPGIKEESIPYPFK